MVDICKIGLWVIGFAAFPFGVPVAGVFTLLIAAILTIGTRSADKVFDEATQQGDPGGQVVGMGLGCVVFVIGFVVFAAMVTALI